MPKLLLRLIVLAGIFLGWAWPVLAQGAPPANAAAISLLPAALTLFLPLGLLLLLSSAVVPANAPAAVINLLVVWAVAALAYFAVGFALNFGGVAQVTPHPDLAGLYWEWYPLDQSVAEDVARLWGVFALQGWALSGAASRPGALLLFLSQLSLVGATAMIPASVALQRGRGAAAMLLAVVTGALVYPVAGNWVWGGGWLSNLGASLQLGHGFVDFGGAGGVFVAGSMLALAALLGFRPLDEPPAGSPAVMPSAYLPILSVLGGGLLLLGWLGLAAGAHNPTATPVDPAQTAVAGVLAALAAAMTAAGYSWFTTTEFNPLMTGRGLAAGLVVALAGAPFVPLWSLVLAGLVMGLAVPPLVYLFERKLRLRDGLGTLATYGVSAAISLVWVGLLAGGQAGQGWNRVGPTAFAGVDGQGVSGLVVAAGLAVDWPGQLQAQLVGLGAIGLWALLIGVVVCQLYVMAAAAWARRRPEAQPDAELPPEEENSPV